ncbi:MAG: UbiA family prenyltransferase [bacterium]|nr:UbiA family prenyltransferase [bacterium]
MRGDTTDPSWNRGDWARLIRLFSMGATVVYAPLGLATAPVAPTFGALLVLVCIGISFHLFAFPLNDVIDLPLDSTNPRRTDNPQVRGLVSTQTMLGVSLIQVPTMALLLFLGDANGPAASAWLVAVAGLAIYDVWGKRIPIPFVADFEQGVGFAGLVLLGAYWWSRPTLLTWLVAAYVVVYIVQINAVHGGMRDLANDIAHGVTTTPVLLGCGVDDSGIPRVTPALVGLALVTEIAMVGLLIGVALAVPQSGSVWWLLPSLAIGLRLFASWLGWQAYRSRTEPSRMTSLGVWHLLWSLTSVVVAGLGGAGWWVATFVAVVYVTPPLWFAWLTRPNSHQH